MQAPLFSYFGTLFVLIGPSGVGKTRVASFLDLPRIITMTSRLPRAGEQDGRDYLFRSAAFMKQAFVDGQMLEYDEHYGSSYGLTYAEAEKQLDGRDAYVILTHEGLDKYRAHFPHVVSLFLHAPFAQIEQQFHTRGESEGRDIRLQAYQQEMARLSEYDYAIENKFGALEETVAAVQRIIDAHASRSAH